MSPFGVFDQRYRRYFSAEQAVEALRWCAQNSHVHAERLIVWDEATPLPASWATTAETEGSAS